MGDLILAVDPSLTSTGWCLVNLADGELLEQGRIVTAPRHGDLLTRLVRLTGALAVGALAAGRAERIAEAVVEVPSGKVHGGRHRGRHGGGGAGLSTYGAASGAVCQLLVSVLGVERVVGVTAEEWAGKLGKWMRKQRAGWCQPEYDTHADPGGDVADALELAAWWRTERRIRAQAGTLKDKTVCK